ncbi:MAG TPA: glycosyltransferase family 39 protein [Bacteroidia bacterium]|nr:glycosyltransferase family 39 protein [Bacteroidia bacterium]
MPSQNKQTPFWLITFSLLIGLTLPTLIQDGMFMDAMLYTSVSHNLSMGIGTFWFPQFSVHNLATLSSFHEQPPLVFGIQALFFKLLGDSLYVERFYTLLTMCITALLIHMFWKDIFTNNNLKKLSWLPILLWISIPVCFWSYSNNMHENTMGIFTLLAVLLMYQSFQTEKNNIALLLLSGVFIFLASLCKGLPGLFPLTTPFLYWLVFRKNNFRKTVLETTTLTLASALIYLTLFLFPDSKESLSIYFFQRALHRINEDPTVSSRFYILLRLGMELLPQIILVLVILIIGIIKKSETQLSQYIRKAIFFISVGLSASMPLMLTLVQKGFYFVPALPYFAIGLAILVAPTISSWIEMINIKNIKYKMFLFTSCLLLMSVTVFAFMQKGKISRNKELLQDVYLIGTIVPKYSTVTVEAPTWNDWDLQCYLIRYFNISLEVDNKKDYFIVSKKSPSADTLLGYQKIDIKTSQYNLHRKLPSNSSKK